MQNGTTQWSTGIKTKNINSLLSIAADGELTPDKSVQNTRSKTKSIFEKRDRIIRSVICDLIHRRHCRTPDLLMFGEHLENTACKGKGLHNMYSMNNDWFFLHGIIRSNSYPIPTFWYCNNGYLILSIWSSQHKKIFLLTFVTIDGYYCNLNKYI